MTTPFSWLEKSVISPSGDYPSKTWCRDKDLKFKRSHSHDCGHPSNSTNGENKHTSGSSPSFKIAHDSVLTLFPPRRDKINSVSCLSALSTSNQQTDLQSEYLKEEIEISKGYHCDNPKHNEHEPSVSPDKCPFPMSAASLHWPSFEEYSSGNYCSESIGGGNMIGFGFGKTSQSPFSKSHEVGKANIREENLRKDDIGFGFVRPKTSVDIKGQLPEKFDFALRLSESKESTKLGKVTDDGNNIYPDQLDSIGFGFGVGKSQRLASRSVHAKKRSKSDKCPESPLLQNETSCKGLERNNTEVDPGAEPVESSLGDDQMERPKTPFSKRSSFVSGTFSFDVRSPLAQNYPPISPFVFKNINTNSPSMSKKKSANTEKILQTCQQKEAIPLKLIFENLRDIKKVGEGVYGEVYSGFFGTNTHARVYKIVAVEGNELINGERQKKFEEILPEIIISQEVSKLEDGVKGNFTDGFVKLYGARVCKGMYPETLVKAWKVWNEKHKSDNDCPNFAPGQLYVVFEFKFGGKDIEEFQFDSAKQTFSAVLQVAHTFAVGECAFGFEHRDAHWGNILVEATDEEFAAFVMNGVSLKVPTYGIKTTVIDFTMSRVVTENGIPAFTDISADEEQFLGTGDLQFDIYRMMREYNNNNWEQFSPKTNIFWIHYLADKMYFNGRYSKETTAEHAANLRYLQRIKELIMNFDSCYEFSTNYLSQLACAGVGNSK